MADSDDPAAVALAAVSKQLHASLKKLEEMAIREFRNGKDDNGDGRKDVKTSHTSFERQCAVQRSDLLSLPPEIRNMIWNLCLLHPEDLATKLRDKVKVPKRYGCLMMTIDTGFDEARPKIRETYETSVAKRTMQSIREHSLRNLALMQTCQAIYNEAAPVLWSQRFYFHSILHLQAFLFSRARLDLVRDIFVWTLDRQCGVNYMPAVCAVIADKVKGLERFEVDMSCMSKKGGNYQSWQIPPFEDKNEIRDAGVKIGFDVYSCMHPWVTKVVRDQGIERLMAILQIPRQTHKSPETGYQEIGFNFRTHTALKRGWQLSANKLKIVHTAAAGEILRLVNLYDK